MESKETQVYLMSADPVPVKVNLCFNNGGSVPYVSLDDWVEFYRMIMTGEGCADMGGMKVVLPMGYLRVNCTLQQFDKFLDFYGIKEGDGMYLAPEDRVLIW